MSLFSALQSSGNTLQVLSRQLEVAQNNVTNASTPGYARQIQNVSAMRFDPAHGLTGGVRASDLVTTRDQYAETAVRRENTRLGYYQQQTVSLDPIEAQFDITGESGIPAALNDLLTAFSSWSANVNDGTERSLVLERAWDLAQSFQNTAESLSRTGAEMEAQIATMVERINTLAAGIQEYNQNRNGSLTPDAGMDAVLHSNLEELSQLAGITVYQEIDGAYTVLLGGQVPLVLGNSQYRLSANVSVPDDPAPTYAGAPPTARILDANGNEVTAMVGGGKLGGLLDAHNVTLAGLLGDSQQIGDLNRLAMGLADRVNALLNDGLTSDGTQGPPLFTYDTDPTRAAATLSLTDITADQLAGIDPGPPQVANGTALKLGALARAESDDDKIDGLSFIQFFGSMASRVGSLVADAEDGKAVQQQALAQAREFRDEISGVSLDEEAIRVLQYQRAYQATAKVITVLDELTETLVGMI